MKLGNVTKWIVPLVLGVGGVKAQQETNSLLDILGNSAKTIGGGIKNLLDKKIVSPLWGEYVPIVYVFASLILFTALFYVLVRRIPAFQNQGRPSIAVAMALAVMVTAGTPFPAWIFGLFSIMGAFAAIVLFIVAIIAILYLGVNIGSPAVEDMVTRSVEAWRNIQETTLRNQREISELQARLNREIQYYNQLGHHLQHVEDLLEELENNLHNDFDTLNEIAHALGEMENAGIAMDPNNPQHVAWFHRLEALVGRLQQERGVDPEIRNILNEIEEFRRFEGQIIREGEDVKKIIKKEVDWIKEMLSRDREEFEEAIMRETSRRLGRDLTEEERNEIRREVENIYRELAREGERFRQINLRAFFESLDDWVKGMRYVDKVIRNVEKLRKELEEVDEKYREELTSLINALHDGNITGALEAITKCKDYLRRRENIIGEIHSQINDYNSWRERYITNRRAFLRVLNRISRITRGIGSTLAERLREMERR